MAIDLRIWESEDPFYKYKCLKQLTLIGMWICMVSVVTRSFFCWFSFLRIKLFTQTFDLNKVHNILFVLTQSFVGSRGSHLSLNYFEVRSSISGIVGRNYWTNFDWFTTENWCKQGTNSSISCREKCRIICWKHHSRISVWYIPETNRWLYMYIYMLELLTQHTQYY